jgi:hypothetical protein
VNKKETKRKNTRTQRLPTYQPERASEAHQAYKRGEEAHRENTISNRRKVRRRELRRVPFVGRERKDGRGRKRGLRSRNGLL